jgi:hypothetical protein
MVFQNTFCRQSFTWLKSDPLGTSSQLLYLTNWAISVQYYEEQCIASFYDWSPQYDWNIVESGIKHHNPPSF